MSLNLWHNIDPVLAESQLRAVNGRLVDLDDALKSGQRMLVDNPNSFSAKLSLESLTQLQERLQAERLSLVRHRKRERLLVALKGNAFADHEASMGHLGIFLVRIQKLYQSIAQAITTGPRLKGPISRDVMRHADLRVADFFPSSFGIEIFVNSGFDDAGESISVSSLQTLFNLLNATQREQEISRLSGELGQRSIGHLRHVVSELETLGAGLSLNWVDSAGTVFAWDADDQDVKRISSNIKVMHETYMGEEIVEGALIGASLLRNRFEFMDMNKNILEGKITRNVKPKLKDYFGKWCVIKLDRIEISDRYGANPKIYLTLIDVQPRGSTN